MSFNLLDLVKNQAGSMLVDQASSFLGENKGATQSAMDSILPSIIGGMMSKASTKDGAAGLLSMITQGGNNGGMLDNVAGLFSGGKPNDGFMQGGSSLISGIFGDKVGGLVDIVSNLSGISKGSSSSLMSMAAPMIMGMISKKMGSGMNASGLASMLFSQKDTIKDLVPAGLTNLLGIKSFDAVEKTAQSNFGSLLTSFSDTGKETVAAASRKVGNAANAGKQAVEETAKSGGSLLRWLLPLLLLVGALWFLMKSCGGETLGDATNSVTNTLSDAADATTNAAGNVANAAGDAVNNAADATKNAAGNVVDAAGNVANAAGDAAGNVVDAAGNVVDAAGDAANAAADATKNAAGNVVDAAKAGLSSISLPGGEKIDLIKGSVEEKMATLLGNAKADPNASLNFSNLVFNSGSANLNAESMKNVSTMAKLLKAYPTVEVELTGHTDNDGKSLANKALSKQRAETVKKVLGQMGINSKRIKTSGKGDAQPVASNDTPEGKAQNRRIEVKITKR